MSELDFLRNVLGIQQEELLRDALARRIGSDIIA